MKNNKEYALKILFILYLSKPATFIPVEDTTFADWTQNKKNFEIKV
jgi:hypothetical protein